MLNGGCHVTRYARSQVWDNGVAAIRIVGSNNFTFEATFVNDDEFFPEGEGYVGSTDGQQPIEVIVESSSLVTFDHMSVRSTNGETPKRLRNPVISPPDIVVVVVRKLKHRPFAFAQESSCFEHY